MRRNVKKITIIPPQSLKFEVAESFQKLRKAFLNHHIKIIARILVDQKVIIVEKVSPLKLLDHSIFKYIGYIDQEAPKKPLGESLC